MVKEVNVLERQRLGGGTDGPPCEQIDYTSTAEVHVLGQKMHPTMRVQLLADPSRAQCTFRQLQPSGMVTRLEGATTALPLRLPRGAGLASAKEHQLQLEEELRLATERFLCSIGVTKPGAKPLRLKSFDSSRRRSMDSSRTAAAQGGGASGGVAEGRSLDVGGSGTKRLSFEGGRHKLSSLSKPSLNALNILADEGEGEPARQHAIVIMHQKVKLRFVPPGVGKLLVGHLMGSHLQSLRDVLAHFSTAQHKGADASGAQQV